MKRICGSMSLRRFASDEAGMTMPLAIITMVLVGVMGAGLLTFVATDLTTVVEVNQGQKALEAADAGVQAARRQLLSDGGSFDPDWSTGMTINIGSDSALVTIQETSNSPSTYRVISEGRVGNARRKVEAIFQSDPAVSISRSYFARGDLTLSGSADPVGVSLFTLGNAAIGGGAGLGSEPDRYYGKWAETSGSLPYPNPTTGSYPNAFNSTERLSGLAGIGALGTVYGSEAALNIRSYGSNSTPSITFDYDADGTPGQQNSEMGFPFQVATPDQDRQEIDTLRQRALELEQANPGTDYYIDSVPGNGVDDAGLPNGGPDIDDWPSGSTFSTVRFYKFASYDDGNDVDYKPPLAQAPCGPSSDPPPANAARGVIVVENGDMTMSGNRGFYGGVITRPYDSSGNLITSASDNFRATGNPCLRGYANTGGEMYISGNVNAGAVPELASLSAFRGSMQMVSWRELYE